MNTKRSPFAGCKADMTGALSCKKSLANRYCKSNNTSIRAASPTFQRSRVLVRTKTTARISKITAAIVSRSPSVRCGPKFAALKTPSPARKN